MPETVGTLGALLTLDGGAFTAAIGKAMLAVDLFEKAVEYASDAVKSLGEFMEDSVSAAGRSQASMVSLASAMQHAGVDGAGRAAEEFDRFAEGMERSTKFTHTAIDQAAAIGVSFGITGQGLQGATKAALDLSTRLGGDLDGAMRLIGKAAEGQTATLQRMGIVMKDTGDPATNLAVAIQKIEEHFGGAAQADADNYAGHIAQLGTAWEGLQESVGKAIVDSGIVNGVIETSTALIRESASWVKQHEDTLQAWIKDGWDAFIIAAGIVVQQLVQAKAAFEALRAVTDVVFAAMLTGIRDAMRGVEAFLSPLNGLLDALVAMGRISSNPLKDLTDTIDGGLDTAIETLNEDALDAGKQVAKFGEDSKTAAGWVSALDKSVRAGAASVGDYNAALAGAGPANEGASKAAKKTQEELIEQKYAIDANKAALDAAKNAANQFGHELVSMAVDGTKAKDVMKAMERELLQDAIDLSTKEIALYIERQQAEAIAARAKIATDAAVAAAEAYAAYAAFPPVAAVAAGDAYASVMSLQAAVPLAEGGEVTGGIPGRDSVHALLMPGEVVLPKDLVSSLKAGGGGRSLTLNIRPNFNGLPTRSEYRRWLRDVVIPETHATEALRR